MEKSGDLSIPKKSNKESSWEELAFAEDDAAGSMWPPRSYTCSFCRRDFKSAQALGGHMNVHRRDRARLKQSDDQFICNKSSSSPEYPSHNNSDDFRQTSCYTLVFNSKPSFFNSQHSSVIDLSSSSSSSSSSLPYLNPSRFSSGFPRKQDTSSSASFVVEPSKNSRKILSSFPRPCPGPSFVEKKRCDLHEIPVMEVEEKRDVAKTWHKAKLNLENTSDLPVSMNLVIHQSFPIFTAHRADEEIRRGDHIRKRRRRHVSPSHPSIFISSLSCNSDIITINDEEIKHKGDRFEDLDLELRLGTDPPKGN